MRARPIDRRLPAALFCVLVLVAACTIEVNINTKGDDAADSPIVTVTAETPATEAPAAEPAPSAEPTPQAEPEPPAAPEPIAAPEPPVVATFEPEDAAVRDALYRFPRAERRTEHPAFDELREGPAFTPFTVAPSILNRTEVAHAMQDNYPPLLRDAGIGGTAQVYFLLDDTGAVHDYRIERSSAHPALDAAALRVAGVYRFAPALNRGEPVPVWVSFPITFQAR